MRFFFARSAAPRSKDGRNGRSKQKAERPARGSSAFFVVFLKIFAACRRSRLFPWRALPSGSYPNLPAGCFHSTSSRQGVMLLQELFDAQIGDPDSQQNHQQACHDPKGSVCGQQDVQRYGQQAAKVDGTMNHHGDRKIIGLSIEPGQQDPNDKHRWPGNHGVHQHKEER